MVYLVGAGPGDPELLTCKAIRAIGEADVLLVDALVNRRVLAHARAGARIVDVGKRGGCGSTPQAFIERLAIDNARAGRVVARVKGGDPFVFGRGAEEAARFAAAGLDVEAIPGVTAGIAAAACAGIALTARGVAQGVTFVTGHAAGTDEPDWAALARTRTTLVLYMAAATLPRIAGALVAGGLAPATPVMVVERASCDDERRLCASLRDFLDDTRMPQVEAPAIVIIGDVAAAARRSAVRSKRGIAAATAARGVAGAAGVAMAAA
jgi:uroporphyrin-III C-methyltransferase